MDDQKVLIDRKPFIGESFSHQLFFNYSEMVHNDDTNNIFAQRAVLIQLHKK
jgi:hypothetical protein